MNDNLDASLRNRESAWSSVDAVVVGIGIAGYAAADALMQLGARVTVIDAANGPQQRQRADVLEVLGARIRLG
ncbi:MAG: FAD-dependent monooxygenase, partial [Actinomycetales bacterium]